MLAGGHFHAAVLYGGGVDADQGRDMQAGVAVPARLHVLVGLETRAARQLEVYLVLVQDGIRTEQASADAS